MHSQSRPGSSSTSHWSAIFLPSSSNSPFTRWSRSPRRADRRSARTGVRSAGRRRLILHDHLTRPLTLHDIIELHLESAQLAYLSACSTTDGSPLQVDESTQLTAAFQLAGYRNVIGTLWPISDQTAAVVARDVYAHLTDDGATRPVLESVAEALHRATREQRERTPVLPTRWAAYVHYGV
ncbi:MAG TPA: CHAT domain-containing protein [Actinocrinis sp.]|uniref:CHAT domain-containing protein n=1 Tax=Actinocrinis sp. TaxID=1920516 RepID=UPI002DDD7759|nr:CHAT domain-containing protein [Actinocrinis sp.]HEV2347138.1 CHAT domain-containing protein [Actinocrinis sp.]